MLGDLRHRDREGGAAERLHEARMLCVEAAETVDDPRILLLRLGDRAMYEAKSAGGNRVKLFSPEDGAGSSAA